MTQFVNGLFESRGDLPSFKNHIRDFLVQSKGFSAQVYLSNICLVTRSLCLRSKLILGVVSETEFGPSLGAG